MNEIEEKAPGFFMAGHYRNGISLGDSIVSGHDVAEKIAGSYRWQDSPAEKALGPQSMAKLAA